MAKMTLETGEDKINQIATLLRRQTLEPAEQEANHLIQEARQEADRMLREAKEEADAMRAAARQEIVKERGVFESSLTQASAQALETLRQQIEQALFSKEVDFATLGATKDPEVVSRLIEAIIQAIEQEGIEGDLVAVLPKAMSKEELLGGLSKRIVERLEPDGVVIGNFDGGAQVKLVDQNVTLDISDGALRELLKRYVRKDFRVLLFGSE